MSPRYLALMAALGLSAIPLATEAEAAVFNSANGHWYEYVGAQVGFADALASAAGATPIAGFESHLATVTSARPTAGPGYLTTPTEAPLALPWMRVARSMARARTICSLAIPTPR